MVPLELGDSNPIKPKTVYDVKKFMVIIAQFAMGKNCKEMR